MAASRVAKMEPGGEPSRPSLPPPPARPSKKEVADYLSQWGVEEAVQEAVNSAIKAKAADPIAHVASILERKGHEMEAKFAEQPSTTATAPPTG